MIFQVMTCITIVNEIYKFVKHFLCVSTKTIANNYISQLVLFDLPGNGCVENAA